MYGKCDNCGKESELEEYKGKHFCKICVLDIRFNDRHANDVKTSKKDHIENNSSENTVDEKINDNTKSGYKIKKSNFLTKFLKSTMGTLLDFLTWIFKVISKIIFGLLGVYIGCLSFFAIVFGVIYFFIDYLPNNHPDISRAISSTVNEYIGYFLLILFVFLFFKSVENMTPEDIENWKQENKISRLEHEIEELEKRIKK